MGTRAGDIDTCVAQFIMDKYNMTADECLTMLNKKSGVLALSNGVSSDFRDLEVRANKGDEACQLALDKFCYEVRKYIGAYAAALGGLDCLVFTAASARTVERTAPPSARVWNSSASSSTRSATRCAARKPSSPRTIPA